MYQYNSGPFEQLRGSTTRSAHTAVTTLHIEPKVATREEPVSKKGIRRPGIPGEDEALKEEENHLGVPLLNNSSGDELEDYFTPVTSPRYLSKKKVTFGEPQEITGNLTTSMLEEIKQALGEEIVRGARKGVTYGICRDCKKTAHDGEFCTCLLCNTRHNPRGLCLCTYCGSREHVPRECTSTATITSKYLSEKVLEEIQKSSYLCRFCKVMEAPHHSRCPYYMDPKEKETSKGKTVPKKVIKPYECLTCGGDHPMVKCGIQDHIIAQGYCDICEADLGRHYEDCPLIMLYNK